ncbi:hypothetical protein CRG86_006420 [Photobacterium leiognathi]|nr:hypothetical protein CRG86_006420 [Photobacterium leiognathi]
MVNDSRRSFIKKSAAVSAGAAAVSTSPNVFASIEKALSIPANRKHGSIKDVEHVVILMQENRSFDHYFGTMPGVRGFADRFPLKQSNGDFVWNQHNPEPNEENENFKRPYFLGISIQEKMSVTSILQVLRTTITMLNMPITMAK